MKFVIDAQLPPIMARWLEDAGHEASHVFDAGLVGAADSVLWQHASNIGAAILTKDEDFVKLANSNRAGPVVVWLRIGNCSNSALRDWLAARLPAIVQMATDGGRMIEVI